MAASSYCSAKKSLKQLQARDQGRMFLEASFFFFLTRPILCACFDFWTN